MRRQRASVRIHAPSGPDTLVAELASGDQAASTAAAPPHALSTEAWVGLVIDAEALGVRRLQLAGDEPLLAPSLDRVVAAACGRGLHTTLHTSGVPLERARLARLVEEGLDAVRLSLEAARADLCDEIAGAEVFERKLATAAWVKQMGIGLTLDVRVERRNLEELPRIVALTASLGADRLDLGDGGCDGTATRDATLAPSNAEWDVVHAVAAEARTRYAGRLDVRCLVPPLSRAASGSAIVVARDGAVLPCAGARRLAGYAWEHVGGPWTRSLADVWHDAPALARFRAAPAPADGTCRCRMLAADDGKSARSRSAAQRVSPTGPLA